MSKICAEEITVVLIGFYINILMFANTFTIFANAYTVLLLEHWTSQGLADTTKEPSPGRVSKLT